VKSRTRWGYGPEQVPILPAPETDAEARDIKKRFDDMIDGGRDEDTINIDDLTDDFDKRSK